MAQRSSLNLSTILLGAIIVLVAFAGWFGWNASQGNAVTGKPSQYQAVFLSNGQVYFGKLASRTGQFITLNDVFYLQAGSNLQSGDATAQSASDLTLVKLGKELHGPSDKMVINRDQVMFWEDLQADSKVVQAISDYKSE